MRSKPSKKTSGQGNVTKGRRTPPHLTWEFKPKLKNEAAVLHSILGIYDIEKYSRIVNNVRDLITQLVRSHGFNHGSKRYKLIKDYTISLIEGRNPQNPEWLATSRVWKIPSKLGEEFTELIADYFRCTDAALQPKYYQVISTILNIVRLVEGLVDPDIESVTDKASKIDQTLLQEFDNYVVETLKDVDPIDTNINLFLVPLNIKKNGPNGVPKLESSIDEAVALLGSRLRNPFRIICNELRCDYLFDYILMLQRNVNNNVELKQPKRVGLSQKPKGETRLRVLAKIPDSGFKTRLVAIVDFWSQLILEPVRAHVQKVIEMKFGKTDFRKSHDLGVAKMVEFSQRCLAKEEIITRTKVANLDVQYLKCYDISSWSDRFHRDLQKIVMRRLFTPRLAEAWAQLVVHCDWYCPSLKRTVKYGQGQGMGTNGSFDIATLTDHLFINYIIDEKTSYKGIFPHNQCYGKVGDDLWIYDPEDKIKEFYEKINLPINFSKSKEFTGKDSVMEFCSRTFLNNTDVSRINPRIISRSKDSRYLPILLGLCCSRGVQLDATLFPQLNNTVKKTGVTYLDNLQDWIIGMLLIGLYEQGSYWCGLDMDYLERNGWIKGDLAKRVTQDLPTLARVVTAHFIIEMIRNEKKVKELFVDLAFTGFKWNMATMSLDDEKINLFDTSSKSYKTFSDAIQCDLSPQHIVVLGRAGRDLRLANLGTGALARLSLSRTDVDLYQNMRDLIKHASQLSYNEGNINYNVERIISTQYKFAKTLSRFDKDFKVFTYPADIKTIPDYLVEACRHGGQVVEFVPEDPEVAPPQPKPPAPSYNIFDPFGLM